MSKSEEVGGVPVIFLFVMFPSILSFVNRSRFRVNYGLFRMPGALSK